MLVSVTPAYHPSTMHGRLVDSPDGVRWEGALSWNEKHGASARSTWVAGKLAGVTDALLSDGSRASIIKTGDPETGGWRRCDADGTWVHGMLNVSEHEIAFIDGNPPQPPVFKSGTLIGDIARDRTALEMVQDHDFACDLYGALCNIGYLHPASGKEYWGTWRRAADLVAHMRGIGECHSDFYMMGNEGRLTTDVADILNGLGWTHIGFVDFESRNRRAAGIVSTCEGRPTAETPEWYRLWGMGLSSDDTLEGRIHRCAVSGRVTLEEWELFWEYLQIEE